MEWFITLVIALVVGGWYLNQPDDYDKACAALDEHRDGAYIDTI